MKRADLARAMYLVFLGQKDFTVQGLYRGKKIFLGGLIPYSVLKPAGCWSLVSRVWGLGLCVFEIWWCSYVGEPQYRIRILYFPYSRNLKHALTLGNSHWRISGQLSALGFQVAT